MAKTFELTEDLMPAPSGKTTIVGSLFGPGQVPHSLASIFFAHFVEYTGVVTSLFPSSLTVSFAWAATVAETLFGILLIVGFQIRMASALSGFLLLSFAIGMVTGLGIKAPFDYSAFSAAAAAFLLAFWQPDRFTLDKLLNRLRNASP